MSGVSCCQMHRAYFFGSTVAPNGTQTPPAILCSTGGVVNRCVDEIWALNMSAVLWTFAGTFTCKNGIWKVSVSRGRTGHPGSVPGGKPSETVSGSFQCCVVDVWAPTTSHVVAANKGRAGERPVKCRSPCQASRGEQGEGRRTCVV